MHGTSGAAVMAETWTDILNAPRPSVAAPGRAVAGGPAPDNAWARAALKGETERVRTAPEGTRNDTLNNAALALGQIVAGGLLDEGHVTGELTAAALAAGLGQTETAATIASGMTAGKKTPRNAPERVRDTAGRATPGLSSKAEAAATRGALDGEVEADTPPLPPSALQSRWVSLADNPNLLIDTPPAQHWLLTTCRDGREVGVFPRGKTGLLVGAGGVSKTMAATQLGVALARGGFFLDTFRAAEPGHVLMALAEEELEECTRRLWRACNALELGPDQRKDLAQRMHLLPLHGCPVAMLRAPTMGAFEVTAIATQLKQAMLDRQVDWGAVILDPLARWSGGGAERDNEAATQFVQIVEDLTKVRGNPSGLLVHHSSKASIATGNSDPRGVSGLHDGFRWVANMDVLKSKDGQRAVRLHNSKSNYSPEFDDLLLVRNIDRGIEGTLRLATQYEAQQFGLSDDGRQKAKADANKAAWEADCDAVLALVPAKPEHVSAVALDATLRAAGKKLGDKTLTKILQHLVSAGQVVDLSNGAQSKPRQWAKRLDS